MTHWRAALRGGALLPLLLLVACTNLPAALDPYGSDARQTARIAWILFAGGGVLFVLVIAFAVYALLARPAQRGWLSRPSFVVGAGIVLPVVTLSALLVYTFKASGAATAARDQDPLRIEIVGEMWWWRVHYLDPGRGPPLATANEVHIPVGRTVEFALRSADVLHSFWVPHLAGKLDLIPGRVNVLRVQADRPGVFRGQCAEFCGAQHAKMAFHVVAHPVAEFDAWLAAQHAPARVPGTAALAHGAALFVTHCGACHAVRGTTAAGTLGPDLTHAGSRRALGAGTLPNNVGTMAGWIAGNQHVKPGNNMPAFDRFSGAELHALAAYLDGLQ